jgi:hypothetical protein
MASALRTFQLGAPLLVLLAGQTGVSVAHSQLLPRGGRRPVSTRAVQVDTAFGLLLRRP